MGKRIGKYKISNKEYTLATSLDAASYTTGNIVITGNANIGAAASDLIGFYDVSGVNQPDAVADAAVTFAAGAIDTGTEMTAAEAAQIVTDLTDHKDQINLILDRLQELGLINT